MRIECLTDLSSDQLSHWQALLATAHHSHPEQDPRFAPVLRAAGQEVRFVLGWEGGDLCAAGLFGLLPHPFLKGHFSTAMAYSGPVCDDPDQLGALLDLLAAHPDMARVGAVRVTPYWLDADVAPMTGMLAAKGWRMSEPDGTRQTGVVDISGSVSDITARFSQTGRRKLRKAERQDLTVEVVTDEAAALELLDSLNRHRAARGLIAVPKARFLAAFRHVYLTNDLGALLAVRHQGRFVAGLVLHRGRDTTHFMHSTHEDAILAELGDLRIAPFLLLEGMKWGNARGCRFFDMEGLKMPLNPSDPLYNVYKYKTEFSPRHVHRVTGHQKIVRPLVYLTGSARSIVMPRVKAMLKRVARKPAKTLIPAD